MTEAPLLPFAPGGAALPVSEARSHASALPVLRAEKLTKVYRSGEVDLLALQDVDFVLHRTEIVVLLGPSGSGKSTFLNLVGGLDRATSGKAWFGDLDLTGCSERRLTRFRRDHVGFVFQFYNLIPSLTASENVALVTDIANAPMKPADALAMVEMQQRLHHFPAQLSGGEQQRVAIARAIAKRPEILLCDEPTGALDSKTGIVVLEAISRINAELGTATVIITHNAAIRQMADRVVTFRDGRIAEEAANAHRLPPRAVDW